MKRGKFMICKNCSANIDDNVAFCPYCGAHNDAQGSQQNAQGYQQSQNENYNQNEQQSGQYFYNGQQNQQYQQQNVNYNPQQMNTEPTKDKLVAGLRFSLALWEFINSIWAILKAALLCFLYHFLHLE